MIAYEAKVTSRHWEGTMRRREFIALMGASVTWPFAALAQEAMPTVGVITVASPTTTIFGAAFSRFMKEFGWEENRNYRTLFRYAEGHVDRFPVWATTWSERVSLRAWQSRAAISRVSTFWPVSLT